MIIYTNEDKQNIYNVFIFLTYRIFNLNYGHDGQLNDDHSPRQTMMYGHLDTGEGGGKNE